VEKESYVLPAGEVMAQRRPATDQGGPLQLLNHCFEAIQHAGHEILLLDQSRPDVALPVVKVLAPGLRHFWARYAPGRLYDVPLKMGWLDRKLTEDEMNPIAMFL
jgi:ribosomal protein S12 methylthiotransferase accessory factor